VTATSWCLSDVDDTPWPQVIKLFKYWDQFPPTHIAVARIAAWLGAAPAAKAPAALNEAEKKAMGESKVLSFKRLPKHLADFVDEINRERAQKQG
jgi:hypothetical protein